MSDRRRYTSVREFVRVVGYEWRTRKAWRDWKAALRGTYWWLVRRYPCELCQGCGRRIMAHTGSWWHADDDLWLHVHGSEAGTLCPRCFTEDAKRKGISVYWQATVDHRDEEEVNPPDPDTPLFAPIDEEEFNRRVRALWDAHDPEGNPVPVQPKPGVVMRCASIGPTGLRCDLVAGHGGWHRTFGASALWS